MDTPSRLLTCSDLSLLSSIAKRFDVLKRAYRKCIICENTLLYGWKDLSDHGLCIPTPKVDRNGAVRACYSCLTGKDCN
jgi:hypothetical protein